MIFLLERDFTPSPNLIIISFYYLINDSNTRILSLVLSFHHLLDFSEVQRYRNMYQLASLLHQMLHRRYFYRSSYFGNWLIRTLYLPICLILTIVSNKQKHEKPVIKITGLYLSNKKTILTP